MLSHTLRVAPETAVQPRAEMLTLDAAGFPKDEYQRLVSAADEDDYVQTSCVQKVKKK
jgi:hypothetical protein